jgi:hypothetical protein
MADAETRGASDDNKIKIKRRCTIIDAHWATRGEGRSKDAQKALVQTWLAQASATVQKAQWKLTV